MIDLKMLSFTSNVSQCLEKENKETANKSTEVSSGLLEHTAWPTPRRETQEKSSCVQARDLCWYTIAIKLDIGIYICV